MEITIVINVPDDFSSEDLANVIDNAGERCSEQIRHGILKHPLRLGEQIMMGSEYDDVEVTMIRVE